MEDITAVGTTTTMDTDIDLVTTITMDTVTIMDAVTVHNQVSMATIEIRVNIIDIEITDQHNTTKIITETVTDTRQIHETTDIIQITIDPTIIEKILTIELHEIAVITVDLLRAVVIQGQVDLRHEDDNHETTPHAELFMLQSSLKFSLPLIPQKYPQYIPSSPSVPQ